MTPKQEAALRQAVDAWFRPGGINYVDFKPYMEALRETLAEQPAQQQEPVAWMDGYRNIYSLEEKAAGCPEATIALVPMANQEKTSGSPINELQCVCGAVWLGEEMVHLPDKRPPASKPLTDEQIDAKWRKATELPALTSEFVRSFARAIEAAHGIKRDA